MAEGKNFEIGAIIKLDGEQQFKAAVSAVNSNIRGLNADMRKLKEEYAGNENSLEALRKKQKLYADILEAQSEKIKKTKEGLDNAKKAQKDFSESLEDAKKKLSDAEKELNRLKETSGTSAEAIEEQQKEVDRLTNALKKGAENSQKMNARVADWEAKLKSAEAELEKTKNKQKENNTYLEEASRSVDKCAKSIDGYGKKVKESTEATIKWGEALKAGVMEKVADAGVAALESLGDATVGAAMELEKAGNQIEASTEVSGKALEQYKDVLESVYANNYGDNLEDVSLTISKITQSMGELDNADLQNVTESAIALQDTFDMDLEETLRGAKNLMYQFGLSADEAFDLLGSGAKAGLNYTDELGDNVSEYAGNFAQAGYSASEYFQLLKNGTENGSYNLDKVNDAINEITNKLADKSIEGSLNIYSTETQSLFRAWQTGGATQKQVIDSIVADINNCTNQQDALTMAATAFGTMGEDSNLKFVQSLTGMGDSFDDVHGKMNEIKNIKYDDLNSQITEITRSIEVKLGKALQKMLPIAKGGLELIEKHLNLVISGVAGLGTAILLNKMFKADFFVGAIKGLAGLVKGLGKAEAAQKLLNLTTAATPWGAIAVAIGGVTAVLVGLAVAAGDNKSELKEMAEEVERLNERADELKSSLNESETAFEENTTSTKAQYGALQIMSDELYELDAALRNTSLSEEEASMKKAQMKYYVDELNEAMPELNLQIDKQNGLLKQSKEYTDAYIESAQNKALINVLEEQLNDLYTAQSEAKVLATEATIKKNEAEEAATNTLEKYSAAANARCEIENKIAEEEAKGIVSDERRAEIQEEIAKNYDLTVERLKEGAMTIDEATYKTNEYTHESIKAGEAAEDAAEAEKEAKEKIEEKKKAIEEIIKQITSNEEEAKKLTEAIFGEGAATEETTEKIVEKTEAELAAIAGTEAQKEALESLRQKYEEVKSSIQQSMEQKINLFAAFDGGDESSLDEMLANLDSQLTGLTNWKSNMEQLAGEVGQTIGPELYSHLVELGPDAANAVQEMVDALNTGGAEGQQKLKELSDKYALELDLTEETSEKMAATKEILQNALRDMGESEADFSGLKESIDTAVESAAQGWVELPEKTREELNQAVEAARQSGAEIPEGLADAIRNGEISPAEAIAKLNGSVQAQFDHLEELAKAAGITIPDDLKQGILQGGDAAVQAIAQLNARMDFTNLRSAIDAAVASAGEGWSELPEETRAALDQAVQAAEQCGVLIPEGLADAIRSGEVSPQQAIEQLNGGIQGQFNTLAEQAKAAGITIPEDIQAGIAAGGDAAVQAIAQLNELLAQEQSKAEKTSEETGKKNTKAVGTGTESAAGEVVGKTGNVMQQGVTTAASYEESFKNVGYNMMSGLAIGLNSGSGLVYDKVRHILNQARIEAEKINDQKSPSKVWRNKIGRMMSEGMALGIADGQKSASTQAVELARVTLQATKDELEIKSPSGVFKKKIGKQIAAGVAFGIKDNANAAGEEAKKLSKRVYDAANKWISKYQKSKNRETGLQGLENEKYLWEQTLKHLKKGTDAYKDAEKKITESKKKIADRKQDLKNKQNFGLSGSGLDMFKTYKEVSAKAEIEYWDIVRKQFKVGTAERIEADQKWMDARESYYEKMSELEEEYQEKSRETNEKLAEDVKNLTEEYENALKDRKETLRSAFGMFDGFESTSVGKDQILANVESQETGFALWAEALKILEDRKELDPQYFSEIQERGPEALADILALNEMSDEELTRFNQSLKNRDKIIREQAEKELKDVREDTEEKIRLKKEQAQKELDAYEKEYQTASAKLEKEMGNRLKNIAKKATKLGEEATAGLLKGLQKKAGDQESKQAMKHTKKEIVDNLASLQKSGNKVGKDTLEGIFTGMGNKIKIQKGAKSIVEQIEAELKKAAGIQSPSKRFRDAIGIQIPAGIAEGMEDGTKKAAKAGTDMIREMLAKAKEQAEEQQAALSKDLSDINGGARITALNALVETPVVQNPVVTVNNTEVAGIVSQMAGFLQEMRQEMQNLKVVLDTGTLVGEISPDVGNNLAAITRRLR